MVLCLPRVLWYNLCVGIVHSVFKTLKGSTFACYRKEDVVSYVIVHYNVRPHSVREEALDLKTDQCNFTGCVTSRSHSF